MWKRLIPDEDDIGKHACQDVVVGNRIYGGVSAASREADRQSRLIDAAVRLIGREGIHGLTVRKVVAEAGVSPRYLYDSFTDLGDLRTRAFDTAAESIADDALRSIGRAGPELDAQLGALIRTLVAFTEGQPDRARLLLVDSYGDPDLAERRLAMTATFAEGFAVYIAGHFPTAAADTVLLAARLIVGGTSEVCTARLLGDGHRSAEDLSAELTAAYLGVVDALVGDGTGEATRRGRALRRR